MKRLFLFLLATGLLCAQTAKFPSAIATDNDLLVGKDRSASTLSSGIDASTLSIPVVDGSVFVQDEVITIDQEQMLLCSVAGNTLTVCSGGRGFAGTSATTHDSGANVRGHITAWHHNALREEVQAIEAQIGTTMTTCTAGRVFFAGSSGVVDCSGNLTWDGSTLTAFSGSFYDSTPTTGSTTLAIRAGAGQSTTNLQEWRNNADSIIARITNTGMLVGPGYNDITAKISVESAGMYLANDRQLNFSSTTAYGGTVDLALFRNSAGLLEVNSGTSGQLRDFKLRRLWAAADSAPSCTSGNYGLYADSGSSIWKKCTNGTITDLDTGAGAAYYQTVQDETTPLTQRPTINFTGTGVTCADNAGATRTDCTIAGGGSATRYELEVTRTDADTLTINPSCSSSTPCNIKGNQFTSSATVDITSGSASDTTYIYLDTTGAIIVGYNAANTYTCSGCTSTSGITSFPSSAVPGYVWPVTTATFDSTLATFDKRSFLYEKEAVAGTGVSITDTYGKATISLDTAVVPFYSTGAGVPSGACTEGTLFYLDTTNHNGYYCTDTDTWEQIDGAGGGGYATIDDEDTPLTQRTTLNFAGAGVTCADDTNQTTCTIPALEATTIRQVYNLSMPTCSATPSVVGYGVWTLDATNGAAVSCTGPSIAYDDAATGKRAFTQVILPANWSSGDAVDAVLYYTTNYLGGSPQTKFFVETACRAGGESNSWSYNTAASQTGSAGTDTVIYSMTVSSIPMTNCAAGEAMRVQLRRADSADEGDTLDAKIAYVVAFQLRYKVTVN